MPGVIDYSAIGGYPGPKHPGSNSDWATDFSDQPALDPGATRGQYAPGTPGTVLDVDKYTGQPFGRNDFVTVGGVPVISGSSEYWAWKNEGKIPQAGGGAAAAPNPNLAAASKAAMSRFNTTLGQTLSGYLSGMAGENDVAQVLASMKAMGQLTPDLMSAFTGSLGGQMTPEQLKRLQELAAKMSVQQTVLPSNIN